MQEPVTEFPDDPQLRGALRRALGRESAPPDIRARIEAANVPKALSWRQSPMYRLAVAAVLLIGFGALGYQIWQMNRPPVYDRGLAITDSVYQAMLTAHEARAEQAGGDAVSSLTGAAGLSKQIGRAVFVADLTHDGWRFDGGTVRNVGKFSAAQLFFTKGKAAISVFSLPASAASGAKDGVEYDKSFNGAAIAGFTHDGGLYCIVGTSADNSLSVEDIKHLLAAHRAELSRG
jgi:hypothetical protein